jgi:hypothetical protein
MVIELENIAYFTSKGLETEFPHITGQARSNIVYKRRVDLLEKIVNKQDVWVRLDGGRRDGTIGRMVVGEGYLSRIVSEEKFEEYKNLAVLARDMAAVNHDYDALMSLKTIKNSHECQETYQKYLDRFNHSYKEFSVLMDDGKVIACDKFTSEYEKIDESKRRTFVILEGYTSSSVYNFNRVPKSNEAPKLTMKDRVGQQIKIGDAIVLVLQNEMILGNVIKATGSGTGIHIKSFEGKMYNTSVSARVLVINDKTKTNMMMAKLTG